MKGDFSRNTFDPQKHYSSVRLQQGRVQLDADWNEQVDILRHALQTQILDLVGPAGGPAGAAGFEIFIDEDASQQLFSDESKKGRRHLFPDFWLGSGRYYIDGLLCENERAVHFTHQPSYPAAKLPASYEVDYYLIYLDVWQREISWIEDPHIRETALNGVDTALRTQVVWQARMLPLGGDGDEDDIVDAWNRHIDSCASHGFMEARVSGSYTGQTNQLYRVEIHSSGEKGVGFKWSRENGSLALPVLAIQAAAETDHWRVSVQYLERDPLLFKIGDWVELACDASVLNGEPLPLCQVLDVNTQGGVLVLAASGPLPLDLLNQPGGHPLLRRWDQSQIANGKLRNGLVPVRESHWIPIENGIEVCFSGHDYAIGDAWQLPARTASGDIEWPQGENGPLGRPAQKIHSHFSPLAVLAKTSSGWQVKRDLRRIFVAAPILETEDLAILKELRSERSELQRLVGQMNILNAELEEMRREVERIGSHLYEECLSVEPTEVGDVVALVPGNKERVVSAHQENATLVIGVVSRLLGQNNAGEYRLRVTTYGKAVCKVRGKIQAGDLLVPSNIAACAEAAGLIFRPGSVLAKALEAWSSADGDDDDDVGTVEVFVRIA